MANLSSGVEGGMGGGLGWNNALKPNLSIGRFEDRQVAGEEASRTSIAGLGDPSASGGATATFYIVVVALQNVKVAYQISKRYSDFLKLYSSLKSRTPSNKRIELFNFPKKTLFNSDAVKRERRARFDEFLKLVVTSYEKIPFELEEFIDIKNHLPIVRSSPNISINPSMVSRTNTNSTTTSGSSVGSSPVGSPYASARKIPTEKTTATATATTSTSSSTFATNNNNNNSSSSPIITSTPTTPSTSPFPIPAVKVIATLKDEFDLAVKVAASKDIPVKTAASNDQKLQMYGLFKLIKDGKCDNKSRPGMFDMIGRAKYDAWSSSSAKVGDSKEAAMADYIAVVKVIYGSPLPGSSQLGVVDVSSSSSTEYLSPGKKALPKTFPDMQTGNGTSKTASTASSSSSSSSSSSVPLFSSPSSSTSSSSLLKKSSDTASLFSPTPTSAIATTTFPGSMPKPADDSYDSLDSFNSYMVETNSSNEGSKNKSRRMINMMLLLHMLIGLCLSTATFRLLIFAEYPLEEVVPHYANLTKNETISAVVGLGVLLGTVIHFLSNNEMILD